jgi:putative membrane protein
MVKLRVLICALAIGAPGAVLAQATSVAPSPSNRQSATSAAKSAPGQTKDRPATIAISDADAHVLLDLHDLNQDEISVAELAVSKAQSPDVKRFGQQLIQDHKRSDEMVLAVAKRRGVVLSALKPTPKQAEHGAQERALMERLKTSSGPEFDRTFLAAMVDGHRKAIDMVEQSRARVEDAELRTMLDKKLPILQKHLQAAQKLSQNSPAPRQAG